MSELYKILSIDYGKRRIGLAITDPMRIIVSPYNTIKNNGLDNFLSEINNIIIKENVKKVVLGCPIKNDKNAEVVEDILNLKSKLLEIQNNNEIIDVFLQDETYTSINAVNRMVMAGKNKNFRKKKENIDSFAAAIILEEFLNENQ